jgi:hypothetical protein
LNRRACWQCLRSPATGRVARHEEALLGLESAGQYRLDGQRRLVEPDVQAGARVGPQDQRRDRAAVRLAQRRTVEHGAQRAKPEASKDDQGDCSWRGWEAGTHGHIGRRSDPHPARRDDDLAGIARSEVA